MIERFTNNSEWLDKLINKLEKDNATPELAASLEERTKKAPKAPNAATSKSKKKTVDKPSTKAS